MPSPAVSHPEPALRAGAQAGSAASRMWLLSSGPKQTLMFTFLALSKGRIGGLRKSHFSLRT